MILQHQRDRFFACFNFNRLGKEQFHSKILLPFLPLPSYTNTAVKLLRMRELSGEEVEEHHLMMMIVHRYRWSLIAVVLHLLACYIIFIVSTAVCRVFWP